MGLPCWFSSSDTGLGKISSAAGSAIAQLDSMLVNGFNPKSCSITVSNSVATVNCSGHGFASEYGKRVQVDGVTGYLTANGIKDISVVDANSFTYPAPGISDGVLTGTITVKRAGLGWAKTYSGQNVAIYTPDQSLVGSDPFVLKVTDTFGSYVTMQLGISHDDSGNISVGSTLSYMGKPNSGASWYFVGDGAFLYWECCTTSSTAPESGGADGLHMWCAGRAVPTQNYFGAATLLCGRESSSYCLGINDGDQFLSMVSDYTSTLTAGRLFSLYNYSHSTQNQTMAMMMLGLGTSFSRTPGFSYPSPVNGQFFCSPVFLSEAGTGASGGGPYCQMPGLRHIHVYANSNSTSGSGARPGRGIYDGMDDGEKLLVLFYQGEPTWSAPCAFRLDKPWR